MDTQTKERPINILVVDDTRLNLAVVCGILKKFYTTTEAKSGVEALALLQAGLRPDLILLDIMMPELDGYETCRQIKANPATANIPVIFLTASLDSDDEEKGFDLGAVDYITKPIKQKVMLARIRNHLQLKAAADFMSDKTAYLESEVALRAREIEAIQDVTILAMASLAETRDDETGNHIRRTQFYVRALARKLQSHPRFADFLSEKNIKLLYKSVPLHDIGKVGIPDNILLKPGRFTPEEFEIMKTHTTLGRDAISKAESQLGIEIDFLVFAKEVAYSHQEKWNGSGYPEGLAGEAIPISARIMAVADVYDALISRRPYKAPMPHAKSVQIIEEGRGSHFDPDIVDAFLEIQDEFHKISQQYADSDQELAEKVRQIELARKAITSVT